MKKHYPTQIKQFHKSTEENYLDKEELRELIKRAELILSMFFPKKDLEIYLDYLTKTPTRALAMKHHRSRFRIRKTCKIMNQMANHFRMFHSFASKL